MFLRIPSLFSTKQSPDYKMTDQERAELLRKANLALGNVPEASRDKVVYQLNYLYSVALRNELAKNLRDSRVSDCIKEMRDRLVS